MKLSIEWGRAIRLADGKADGLIYKVNLDRLPRKPGIYVFGRRWGRNFEALYVGRANKIRGRVNSQLNNLRLMQYLKRAKSGKRVVLAGVVTTRPGQKRERALAVAERVFIRYFLSEGHNLVNKQGVRIRRHEVSSSGKHPKRFIPQVVYLEKAKGE